MNFKSQTMKRAWTIRKLAAVQYGCRCNQISWKECLQMADTEEAMNGIQIEFPEMCEDEKYTLMRYIRRTLEHLPLPCEGGGLSGRDVEIKFVNSVLKRSRLGVRLGYCTPPENGRCAIVISTLYKESIFSTVAHELRHAWQFKTQLLVPGRGCGKFVWKGEKVANKTSNRYIDRPEEIDANRFADRIVALASLFGL